jgi:hypothetical protein
MTTMDTSAALAAAAQPPPADSAIPSAGAEVDLDFLEGQLNYRLLFGRPEFTNFREHHFGSTKRTAVLRPGARFGLDLWEGRVVLNRSREPVVRTGEWRVLVLEVGAPGDRVSRVPQVRPGAHILLEARGVRRCKFLLRWLAELETQGDIADLPREFFLSRDLWFRGVAPERCAPAAFSWSRHADRG